jgi:hypothetical protein
MQTAPLLKVDGGFGTQTSPVAHPTEGPLATIAFPVQHAFPVPSHPALVFGFQGVTGRPVSIGEQLPPEVRVAGVTVALWILLVVSFAHDDVAKPGNSPVPGHPFELPDTIGSEHVTPATDLGQEQPHVGSTAVGP